MTEDSPANEQGAPPLIDEEDPLILYLAYVHYTFCDRKAIWILAFTGLRRYFTASLTPSGLVLEFAFFTRYHQNVGLIPINAVSYLEVEQLSLSLRH